jgi:hypothetical protein
VHPSQTPKLLHRLHGRVSSQRARLFLQAVHAAAALFPEATRRAVRITFSKDLRSFKAMIGTVLYGPGWREESSHESGGGLGSESLCPDSEGRSRSHPSHTHRPVRVVIKIAHRPRQSAPPSRGLLFHLNPRLIQVNHLNPVQVNHLNPRLMREKARARASELATRQCTW